VSVSVRNAFPWRRDHLQAQRPRRAAPVTHAGVRPLDPVRWGPVHRL